MKKGFKIVMSIFLLCLFNGCSQQISEGIEETYINPYQGYMDKTEKAINMLSPELKKKRNELINKLQKNSIYKSLVSNGEISTEYLETLNAISHGVSRITPSLFTFENDIIMSLIEGKNGEDKKNFVITIVALAMDENAGIPLEILTVFDNYQKIFGFYGFRGTTIVIDNREELVSVDFDLTGFIGVVCPDNEVVLEAIFEARSRSISSWNNLDNGLYIYYSSPEDYINYVSTKLPRSKFFIDDQRKVTAKTLYKEYELNEVKASNLFNNKMIMVEGAISDFGNDLSDDPYITFKIDDFKAVTCYFTSEFVSKISNLNIGDEVIVIGNCQGVAMGNIVIMESEFWK